MALFNALSYQIKGIGSLRAKWPVILALLSGFFNSPLTGMLVHRRVTPSIRFAGIYLDLFVAVMSRFFGHVLHL